MTAPDAVELLTPEQLRAKLGISQATYFRWLREGRLKGVLVGRRRRFPAGLVDELRQDPDQAHQRRNAVAAAIAGCREQLARAGFKKKEIDVMAQKTRSEGEGVATMLIQHALRKGASDLHIEPVADGLAVRERIHGILRRVDPPIPAAAQQDVMQAIKQMAGMQAAVTNMPQDSRFFFDYEGSKVDVRPSVYPTALGESVVLRLLYAARITLSFGKSGFSRRLIEGIQSAIRHSRGVFLINGPTDSGKTTTAYSLISDMNKPGVKIMTVEDPVEFLIDGVMQAQVQRDGLTFLGAMKAMQRNGVDVGFVGELRDSETIRMLYQMGIVGTKMISTLHTNDAVSALSVVLAIGELPAQYVADSTLGILNQRLAAKSCPHCRKMGTMTRDEATQLGLGREDFKVARNAGCPECDGTGVLGRTAVGELLTMSAPLRKAIIAGATSADDLRKALPADHRFLRDDVLEHLRSGNISAEQAIQALG